MTEDNTKNEFLECEKIFVDIAICTKCKACVNDCPVKVYFIENNELNLENYADKKCMECGHCVAVCPVNAINLKNPLYKDVESIPRDIELPSYNELMNLFKTNRSIRQFKDKPIPDELWNKLIAAARSAPTGHNFQEVEFTVVRTPEALEKFNFILNKGFLDLIDTFEDENKRNQVASSMSKKSRQLVEKIIPGLKKAQIRIKNGEDPWRWGGELLIIHGSKKPTSLIQDCSLAAAYAMMAARSLGLGTCSLDLVVRSISHNKYLSRFIKLPRSHSVPYVLAVGFPKVKYYRIPARNEAQVNWF
jgi:nitroreductase/NAD-dependent dihydropyrimidine dehydrogenase PreA subunit